MARPLRIEFPNAIYHVMARGNGRQRIFHADADYQRMTDGLAKTIARTGWQVFAFVWMPNHIHLFVRTPKPNLSVGMQYLGERLCSPRFGKWPSPLFVEFLLFGLLHGFFV